MPARINIESPIPQVSVLGSQLPQGTVIALTIVAAFLVFITVRGELGEYISLLA